MLRKYVFRVGKAALIANLHREVAPILRDLGRWGQVIGGRQLPFALFDRKKLYSNVNYIRVRSLILGGTPKCHHSE